MCLNNLVSGCQVFVNYPESRPISKTFRVLEQRASKRDVPVVCKAHIINEVEFALWSALRQVHSANGVSYNRPPYEGMMMVVDATGPSKESEFLAVAVS